ncbi:unnamed protein product [Adineta steineri]|uniref:Uncharacterized protein n=1 Tax=Adineta steineri TaxID=433720 RepID=A0A813MUK4_9BILA|nr:unnamed protein product [Adineta steineri]CAF0847407.1 unnamed protein product [Adineta steineri]CAF1153555.1 unnamed protein product [Adineta steineri]
MKGHYKLCDQNYKDKNGLYSNFLKHIKRKHPRQYKQLNSKNNNVLLKNVILENDDQPLLELSSSESKQNRINMAIAISLIIKCNLPLNLAENNAFRDFLK